MKGPTHNTLGMLTAALMTNRTELLNAWQANMEALVAGDEPLDKVLVGDMVKAIGKLSEEVFDLRRTVLTMRTAISFAEDNLKGITGHLTLATEVAERGWIGSLPDHHAPRDILAALKQEKDT